MGGTHHMNIISKMMFGEISDYSSIPVSAYRFEGSDIIINEFTREKKQLTFEKKINIADVVYALNDSIPVKTSSSGNEITFYEFGKTQPTVKTIKELQDEIVKQYLLTIFVLDV